MITAEEVQHIKVLLKLPERILELAPWLSTCAGGSWVAMDADGTAKIHLKKPTLGDICWYSGEFYLAPPSIENYCVSRGWKFSLVQIP